MSTLAGLFVAIATLGTIGAILWLLWWTSRSRGTHSSDATTGHVWDDDLRELNNPLPRWWLILFILTVVFGVGYLILFPGLGNYRGSLGWSQVGQYREQSVRFEAALAEAFAPFQGKSVTELEVDDGALRVGRNLFLNNCAGCHGSDGRGAAGFPDLTDHDWLWGGTPEALVASIGAGRTAAMPAWGAILGREGIGNVLAYVLSLSGRHADGDVVAGAATYSQLCSACHGVDGKGIAALGAPNLADDVWLYGGAPQSVRLSIVAGRQGQMPAHAERLGDLRTRLLAAYVLSLQTDADTQSIPRVVQ